MNTCSAWCVADDFSFNQLTDVLSKQYKCHLYRDVLYINYDIGHIFVFPYGVFVVWGVSRESAENFMQETKPFWKNSFETALFDNFGVTTTEHGGVRSDIISLASDDVLEKLAISHGIAQSVKLQEFEARAQSAIEETAHIPQRIAQFGKTSLSRRQIAKMRGKLYVVKSDINLRYDLLDTPEFFWEYPELEPFYTLMAKYLDVHSRIEILNKKIEVIHELLSVLADEQSLKYSFTLEWIIISLIGLETLLFLFLEISMR